MLLTWARCYIVTRTDGWQRGVTEHNAPLLVDGVRCDPAKGLSASSAESRIGGAVDTIDVTTILDDDWITRADVMAGIWDSAELRVMVFDWRAGTIVREFPTYLIADTEWTGGELKGTLETKAAVALNRRTGLIGSPTCNWMFGDANCTVDASAFAADMVLTGIADTILSGTVPVPSAGQWAGGFVVWGAERSRIVQTGSGAVYIEHPFSAAPAVGDTVSLEPGCSKMRVQCKSFDNWANFGGHGHRAPNAAIVSEIADRQDGQTFDGSSRFES